MKKSLLLFSILLSSILTNAQWVQQTVPLITDGTFFDVEATDANTVWANIYYDDGTQLNGVNGYAKTVDGGTTWRVTTRLVGTPLAYYVANVWPLDSDTCYAAMFSSGGTGGGIYKTIDGGANWTRKGVASMFNSASFPDVVYFFNAAEGVAIGDPNPDPIFEIYYTSNYGSTWTKVAQADIPDGDAVGEFGIVNLFAAFGDHIWFGTDIGNVYHSRDKGHTWTKAATNMIQSTQTIEDMVFVDTLNGFCFQTGLAYATTDGGDTWNLVSAAGTIFQSDADYIPGTTTLVSSGSSGTGGFGTSYSTDLGATWNLIDTNISHTAMDWIDPSTGWTGEFYSTGSGGGAYKYTGQPVAVNPVNGKSTQLSVYPNPSSGYVTVKLTNANDDLEIRVFNSTGQEVYTNKFDHPGDFFARVIDLGKSGSGLYTIVLDSPTFHQIRKVIVN